MGYKSKISHVALYASILQFIKFSFAADTFEITLENAETEAVTDFQVCYGIHGGNKYVDEFEEDLFAVNSQDTTCEQQGGGSRWFLVDESSTVDKDSIQDNTGDDRTYHIAAKDSPPPLLNGEPPIINVQSRGLNLVMRFDKSNKLYDPKPASWHIFRGDGNLPIKITAQNPIQSGDLIELVLNNPYSQLSKGKEYKDSGSNELFLDVYDPSNPYDYTPNPGWEERIPMRRIYRDSGWRKRSGYPVVQFRVGTPLELQYLQAQTSPKEDIVKMDQAQAEEDEFVKEFGDREAYLQEQFMRDMENAQPQKPNPKGVGIPIKALTDTLKDTKNKVSNKVSNWRSKLTGAGTKYLEKLTKKPQSKDDREEEETKRTSIQEIEDVSDEDLPEQQVTFNKGFKLQDMIPQFNKNLKGTEKETIELQQMGNDPEEQL